MFNLFQRAAEAQGGQQPALRTNGVAQDAWPVGFYSPAAHYGADGRIRDLSRNKQAWVVYCTREETHALLRRDEARFGLRFNPELWEKPAIYKVEAIQPWRQKTYDSLYY